MFLSQTHGLSIILLPLLERHLLTSSLCGRWPVGGALGWKTKGSLDAKFEDVAFGLEPSTTSSPKIGEAKTEFGYHIIMVSLFALVADSTRQCLFACLFLWDAEADCRSW